MRVVLMLGVAAYLQILTNVYIERISVTWAYEGLRYSPPPAGLQSVTWALAFLPALWLPVALKRPSQVVYWFVYVIVYVPTCVLTLFSSTIQPELLVVSWSVWHSVSSGSPRSIDCPYYSFRTAFCRRFPSGRPWPRLGSCATPSSCPFRDFTCRWCLSTTSTACAPITKARSTTRPILGYVVTWQVSLINPFLIAYGLARKRPCGWRSG